jgi:hypothetical protein
MRPGGPRARLDVVEMRKTLSPGRKSNPESPVVHFVVLKWNVCGLNWTADTV